MPSSWAAASTRTTSCSLTGETMMSPTTWSSWRFSVGEYQ
jgi:hypothetical protein